MPLHGVFDAVHGGKISWLRMMGEKSQGREDRKFSSIGEYVAYLGSRG